MATQLTVVQVYDLYLDTLTGVSTKLRVAPDEMVETAVFEDFHMGVLSFFHESTLHRLIEAQLITDEEAQLAARIYRAVCNLETSEDWNIARFRVADTWSTLLGLVEQLRTAQLHSLR